MADAQCSPGGASASRVRRRDVAADTGATAVEYGMVMAMVAVVIVVAVSLLGGQVGQTFNRIAAAMTQTAEPAQTTAALTGSSSIPNGKDRYTFPVLPASLIADGARLVSATVMNGGGSVAEVGRSSGTVRFYPPEDAGQSTLSFVYTRAGKTYTGTHTVSYLDRRDGGGED